MDKIVAGEEVNQRREKREQQKRKIENTAFDENGVDDIIKHLLYRIERLEEALYARTGRS